MHAVILVAVSCYYGDLGVENIPRYTVLGGIKCPWCNFIPQLGTCSIENVWRGSA